MYKKYENAFLNSVSAECNYIDKAIIKDIYLGMIRAVIKGLRTTSYFRLPDFVDISIEDFPEKMMTNRHGTGMVRIPETIRIKAKIAHPFRKYFKP